MKGPGVGIACGAWFEDGLDGVWGLTILGRVVRLEDAVAAGEGGGQQLMCRRSRVDGRTPFPWSS